MKYFIIILVLLNTNSCSLLPNYKDVDLSSYTQEAAKKALSSEPDSFILNNSPVLPSTTNPFSNVVKLPNGEFRQSLKNQPEIIYNEQGEMLLQPGDYVIPVMTFCLKNSAQSPRGYLYTLNTFQGSSAKIIKVLSLKVLEKLSIKNLIYDSNDRCIHQDFFANNLDDILQPNKIHRLLI